MKKIANSKALGAALNLSEFEGNNLRAASKQILRSAFNGKLVDIDVYTVYSYDTPIAMNIDGEWLVNPMARGGYSSTTSKHLTQVGGKDHLANAGKFNCLDSGWDRNCIYNFPDLLQKYADARGAAIEAIEISAAISSTCNASHRRSLSI